MTETIVLGLDGANWALLEPWLEAGNLPNIQSLREEGTWSDMESCLPPVTCPNWRCYSTGKNPGKLGVFWWEKIDTNNRTLSTPSIGLQTIETTPVATTKGATRRRSAMGSIRLARFSIPEELPNGAIGI